MIARLKCWLWGHKRGKKVGEQGTPAGIERIYECPRCRSRWVRKGKS